MKVADKEIAPLHHRIDISVEPEDYQGKFAEDLKKYARRAEMPGFRKGKVPAGLLKKMHGNSILAELLSELVNDAIGKHFEEDGGEVLLKPSPVADEDKNKLAININEPKIYEFSFEYGLEPDFELDSLFTPDFGTVKYKVKVDDEFLQKEVAGLRKRLGERVEVEGDFEEEDALSVEVWRLGGDGEPLEGDKGYETSVMVNMFKEGGPREKVQAMQVNDTIDFDDVYELFDRTPGQVDKHILGIAQKSGGQAEEGSEGEAAESRVPQKCRILIKKAYRVRPAEMNAEFFNGVFPDAGQIETEGDFLDKFRERLAAQFDDAADMLLMNDFYKGLADKLDFELPDGLIEQKLSEGVSENPEEGEGEVDNAGRLANFKRFLKHRVFQNKAMRKHGIKVTNDEIKRAAYGEAADFVRSLFGQVNYEMVESFANKQLENEDYVEELTAKILDKKVFDAVKGQLNPKEAKVSVSEFEEIVKERREEDGEGEEIAGIAEEQPVGEDSEE